MKTASYALTFSFGVFVALLIAFVATGGSNGAAAVLLGAWGAWWLMMAGALVGARYNASDAVDHFDDDPVQPRRYLRPPVQHVLTIRHEGQPADLATVAPERWEVHHE